MLMQWKGLARLRVRDLVHICQRECLVLLVLVSHVDVRAHWLLFLTRPGSAAIDILLCIADLIAMVVFPLFVFDLLGFT